MEALTFPVENEHVFFFLKGRVTTKQCDNCENEFTVPGLLHSSYLSPLKKKKKKKYGKVQSWPAAWTNILHHQQKKKHPLIEYLVEDKGATSLR